MLKQAITAFLYYSQEMLILLFCLTVFTALNGDELGFLAEYYSWIIFLFLSGVIPFLFMGKNARGKWFYFHLPIAFLFGLLVWEFTLATLLVLTLVPFWRMVHALETPLRTEHLVKRFAWFIGCIIVSYLFTWTMTDTNLNDYILSYMWSQFVLLILGLLSSNYLKAREEANVAFGSWLKNQSLLIYLGLGFSMVAWAGSHIMPLIRFSLSKIPDGIVFILSLPLIDSIFRFLIVDFEERERVPPSQEDFEGPSQNLVEEVIAQSSQLPDWINQALLILVQIAVIGLVIYVVYLIVRNFYFVPSLSSERAEGKSVSITGGARPTRSRVWFRRKTNWAQDEIRKLYQSLLVFAEQKGYSIPVNFTARTWNEPYHVDDELSKVWDHINRVYEQKRYSNTPLNEKDVEAFKKEVKLAKSEMKLFYRIRKYKT